MCKIGLLVYLPQRAAMRNKIIFVEALENSMQIWVSIIIAYCAGYFFFVLCINLFQMIWMTICFCKKTELKPPFTYILLSKSLCVFSRLIHRCWCYRGVARSYCPEISSPWYWAAVLPCLKVLNFSIVKG